MTAVIRRGVEIARRNVGDLRTCWRVRERRSAGLHRHRAAIRLLGARARARRRRAASRRAARAARPRDDGGAKADGVLYTMLSMAARRNQNA